MFNGHLNISGIRYISLQDNASCKPQQFNFIQIFTKIAKNNELTMEQLHFIFVYYRFP